MMPTRRDAIVPIDRDINLGFDGLLRRQRPSLRDKPGRILPPYTVRATFGDSGLEYKPSGAASLYEETEFGFIRGGLPTEINFEGDSLPLSAIETKKPITDLFDSTLLYDLTIKRDFYARYKNTDAQKIIDLVYERINYLRSSSSEQDIADYAAIDPDFTEEPINIPNDIGRTVLNENDGDDVVEEPQVVSYELETTDAIKERISDEAWSDTLNWFHSLLDTNESYTTHDITIEIGKKVVNLKRLIIGDIKYTEVEEGWEIDKTVLETLIFMNKEFGFEIPDNLLVVTLSDTEGNEYLYSELRQNDLVHLGCMQGIADRSSRMLISIDRASQVVRQTKQIGEKHVQIDTAQEIDAIESERTHRHEATHVVDKAPYGVTSHREGFAVAMEFAFDLDDAISTQKYLQERTTRKKVDESYLESLMSSTESERFLNYEPYYTAGALFCFLVDKFARRAYGKYDFDGSEQSKDLEDARHTAERNGRRIFGNFYRLLTGESVAFAVDSNVVAMHSVKSSEDYTEGSFSTARSLRNSLRAVLMLEGYDEGEEGKTTDQIINEYLQEFCDLINIPDKKVGE